MSTVPIASQINEKVICVLKHKSESNNVELEYLPIKRFFVRELSALENICIDSSTSLIDLVSYINQNPVLDALDKKYQYCQELDGSYQELEGQSRKIKMYIIFQNNVILEKAKMPPDSFDLNSEIQYVKGVVLGNYRLWVHAYCMHETHKAFDKETSILVFSHRKIGWSKRPHKLTPNFTVQIDTNFGYGRSSYFYGKLTYKEIDIIPFSAWVEYRYANFFEIIRYTSKYDLKNERWLDAMVFCRNACNLSLADEEHFVEKYIVNECQKMVEGLESFLNRGSFTLEDFQFGRDERILIEFRGEKISGALNFIEKILDFKNIFAVNALIMRIEECNRIIQPILAKELVAIAAELEGMNQKMEILKPDYLPLDERNQHYNKKREVLKKKLMIQDRVKEEELDHEKLNTVFLIENPEYNDFLVYFTPVSNRYIKLLGNINATTKTQAAITGYSNKIISYLSNKY